MSESIFHPLLMILREWRTITRPRQRDLLRLCNQKFEELQQTHGIFMRYFEEIEELLSAAIRSGPQLNTDLEDQIRKLDRARREGRQGRLASFQQAKVYATENFAKKTGLFGMVPLQVIEHVKAMMNSFVEYFERQQEYEHEAAHVTVSLQHTLRESSARNTPLSKRDYEQLLLHLGRAKQSAEFKWVTFSRDYFRAYATFADYGIFIGVTQDTAGS